MLVSASFHPNPTIVHMSIGKYLTFLPFNFLTGPLKNILLHLDPEFFQRVTWLKPGTIARVNNGKLVLAFHPTSRKYGANRHLQKWLKSLPPRTGTPNRRTVVFYSRVPPQANHGRIMDNNHNQEIMSLIQRIMDRHHRVEKLVEYDGTTVGKDGDKRPMSILEQFQLFRSASTVIGPHG